MYKVYLGRKAAHWAGLPSHVPGIFGQLRFSGPVKYSALRVSRVFRALVGSS